MKNRRISAFVAAVFSFLCMVPVAAIAEIVVVNRAKMADAHFTMNELDDMPQHSFVTQNDFIDEPSLFSGPLLRTVVAKAGLELNRGESIQLVAIDGYQVTVPASEFLDFDVILASTRDGERMSARAKGPIWVMYPISDIPELQDSHFSSRLVWRLHKIEIVN